MAAPLRGIGRWLWNSRCVDRRLLGFRYRVLRLEGVGNQKRLVRVESFCARPVEAAQQEIEPVLQVLVFMPRLPQRDQQLPDHLLKDDGIVRQLRRRIRGEIVVD